MHSTPPEHAHNHRSVVPAETLEAIRQYDTCTIANAIERFGVRLRNEGYTRPGLHCFTNASARILGYAAPCRIRSAEPPVSGNAYFDRTDWWEVIQRLPSPRIAVIEDLEGEHASGSTLGEVHAAILQAFRCAGVITNGAVRDLPAIRRLEFPVFARAIAVSHSYAHVVEYGTAVEIFGLEVRCEDLLYADCHGAISIPVDLARDLPAVAAEIRASERRIIDFCRSPGFSPHGLLGIIKTNP